MKPIDLLIAEHRLILRMIALMEQESNRIRETGMVSLDFVGGVLDFIRTYADRTHHGKEENILFRDLAQKPLSEAHKKAMEELLADHTRARGLVKALSEDKERQARGEDGGKDIAAGLKRLAGLYPGHIVREEQFFLSGVGYFSEAEQPALLARFYESDRQVIHQKYQAVVAELEKGKGLFHHGAG